MCVCVCCVVCDEEVCDDLSGNEEWCQNASHGAWLGLTEKDMQQTLKEAVWRWEAHQVGPGEACWRMCKYTTQSLTYAAPSALKRDVCKRT